VAASALSEQPQVAHASAAKGAAAMAKAAVRRLYMG
jgi:hypothetical protein